jgi:hypothetical protein
MAVTVAVLGRRGMGWRLRVMVLGNIAKAIGAARHGLARPSSRRKRRVEKNDGSRHVSAARTRRRFWVRAFTISITWYTWNNIPNRVRQKTKSVSKM